MRLHPAMLVVICSLAAAAALPACAPDESSAGEMFLGNVASELPLSAVTGVAASDRELVVGGVSADPNLFWDAWVIRPGTSSPRRLAPIGNNLVAVDATGALWTDITDYGASGRPTYETRLSPSDGSASRSLSPELPAGFSAERAVVDGEGGWLLAGSEDQDGATHGSVFAVDPRGHARRLPCDLGSEAPLVLDATLAGDVLQLTVQYGPEGPTSTVTVPRPE